MDRLTQPGVDYCKEICGAGDCVWKNGYMKCADAEIYNKLRAYEDADEDGRLLVLPCKIGTPIYWINFNLHDGYWIETGLFALGDFYAFGKSVFLTREEAEAALRKEDAE